MSQTTVNLGYVLINRGEYVADPETKYYKDNVVQYQGSAFIASPVDYGEETNPLAYVTTAPYDTDPNNPNEGWKVFASDAAYVNSFMFFIENPEWAYVVCDKEDKILFGVKQDGDFYFGAGVPLQVQEYVEQRISEVSPENYEQVLAFLQDYLGSDATLKMLLDNKTEISESNKIQTNIGLFVCTSSPETVEKAVAASGFKKISGGAFKIKFTSYNTADNPTLNINNTGAKPIIYNSLPASSTNTWSFNEIVEFFYDPTYNSNEGAWIGTQYISRDYIININQLKNKQDAYTDISAARTDVPEKYRKSGIFITYLLSYGWRTEQFVGSVENWNNYQYWNIISPIKVVDKRLNIANNPTFITEAQIVNVNELYSQTSAYATKNQARNAVESNLRKNGMIITYLLENTGWITEQYLSESITHWTDNSYWKTFNDYTQESAEIDLTKVDNLLSKEKQYLYKWEQGTANADGTPDGNAARIMKVLDYLESGTYSINIPNGYEVAISQRKTLNGTAVSSGWLSGNIDFNVTYPINILIMAKTNHTDSISPDEGICLTFDSLNQNWERKTNAEKYEEWQQGGVYTSGENIGQIGYNYNIRCTKKYTNVKAETAIAYHVQSNYKITFIEWDGTSPTVNIQNSFTSIQQGDGVYITTYPNVYIMVGLLNDADFDANRILDKVRITISETLNALSRVVGNIAPSDSKIPYWGERLPFGHDLQVKLYNTFSNWVNMQGCAAYNNYLVCCQAIDEIIPPTANGFIYDIATGEKKYDLYFPVTLNGITYGRPHANQVCFGKEFYNADSKFPLLYISQTLEDKPGHDQQVGVAGGVLVYDLQYNENEDKYTPVLVQVILPDVEDEALMANWGHYTPNYVVDYDNDCMYVLNYPQATWGDFTGKEYITKLKLPKLSDGELITLTGDDVLDHFTLPTCRGIQMTMYFGGKLYCQEGVGKYSDCYLRVVDLTLKTVTTDISLYSKIPAEPQGIIIYNNNLLWYTNGTSGKIYSLIF